MPVERVSLERKATKMSTVHFFDPSIQLGHGAGGRASRRLIEGLVSPALGIWGPSELEDGAMLVVGDERLVMTTDSFVVSPRTFPGGSIGELAVNGTLNDLAVSGAAPLAISVALILEAGLASDDLYRELEAIARCAGAAGVSVATGDTKVVEHGRGDGLFITTTGVGRMHGKAALGAGRVRPGDAILLSGAIGDHGMTVMLARGELDLASESLRSDTRPVWPYVEALLDRFGPEVRWMRDPTRGGLATTLNELATSAKIKIVLDEGSIVIHDPVRGACEILGIDPLHVANEGQFVAVVSAEIASDAKALLRSLPGGGEAMVIGEVEAAEIPVVVAVSGYGGSRVIDMLTGDPLPRIC